MTQMTQLEIVGTQAVPFAVHVRPHLSRSDRQRFFRSMRQAVARMGYPMAASGGMCIVLAPMGQSARCCRDDVLVWLANQKEVQEVVLDLPREARSFLRGTLAFADSEGRPIRSHHAELTDLVRCIALGALAHASAMATVNATFEPWHLAGDVATIALQYLDPRYEA